MIPAVALANTANADGSSSSADSTEGNAVLSAGSQEGTGSDGGSDRPDPPSGDGKGGGSDTKTFEWPELVDASSVFGENRNYAIAVKVTGIPKAMFDQTFCVRAYTIAEDGTVIYGMPRAVTVSSLESQTS